MPVNRYFNQYDHAREQDLYEDLIIEAIKQYGVSVRYVPRTIVREDHLFGEDTLSIFDDAIEVEVYLKSVDGFEGEGHFLSKFGIEIRDEATFTISKKRFDQSRSEKLTTEVGYNILLETADTTVPSRQYLSDVYEGHSLLLEANTGQGYSITSNRPMEGDLIYLPFNRKLFEIKFVEHEDTFYQFGRFQTYDLKCELFEYSSERINTNIPEIDGLEDLFSLDVRNHELLTEDNNTLVLENGGKIILEHRVEDSDYGANNEYIRAGDSVFANTDVVDFSELNAFGWDNP